MTRDEIANLLDSILDKELGDLDIPSFSDWEKNREKVRVSITNGI